MTTAYKIELDLLDLIYKLAYTYDQTQTHTLSLLYTHTNIYIYMIWGKDKKK